jgi:predicted alpha/beta-hydrolase family hydrolase
MHRQVNINHTIPESFVNTSLDPPVRGFLHKPSRVGNDGLVLTHGAGGNARAALLVALADSFADGGFYVLRCDLPYRQNRPNGPPRPGDAARDREGLKSAVAAIRKLATGRVVLGGHSYGGRQATMLCADEPDLVHGLLLTSYPLHPPGRPEQLRVQHWPRLRSPSLFVEGTRDAFGTIAEVERALKLIPAKTKLVTVEGAGHDLGFKGRSAPAGLAERILAEFQSFFL